MNISLKKLILLLCAFCTISLSVSAQSSGTSYPSTNNPLKYNKSFDGIGPKVYILPRPKTEVEIIMDSYVLKKREHYQVDSLLLRISFKKELKKFVLFAPADLEDSLKNKNEEQQLIAAIEYFKTDSNKKQLADWQNNLAVLYITSGKYDQAYALLLASSANKEKFGSIEEQFIVLNNFALLELKSKNNIKALSLYDKLLERAKKSKDINYQALSYIAIAKLEARLGNFLIAHNLIIKKSMPLLQKSKNYSRIVFALNELASFKELQKSDTEAKWIYLQAIDVAQRNQDEPGLAISFFNLAQLKHRIGDENLAIADYKAAKAIAVKNKMDDLLIAINDEMGDAYLKLNDYKAAALLLNEYQLLKSNLLNQYL